ncbi:uncharacterized protein LOC131157903 [Malania oleifera]|uniref:uncharacterized protein LOC131157903 n=1 Tax=Malania oleifera TaxID=397392 RepID=UPI0025AE54E7|nr:uncharacterized protein LOC131157903 [Malania oleifera]
MASGAADGLLRCVFEGCISGVDTAVDRRPYHRNCGCALHKSRRGAKCPHSLSRSPNVSYPIRRAWSEGCLALAASAHSSPSSSPAAPFELRKSNYPATLADDDEEPDRSCVS